MDCIIQERTARRRTFPGRTDHPPIRDRSYNNTYTWSLTHPTAKRHSLAAVARKKKGWTERKERKPLHRRFVDERFNALALPMLPLLGEGVDVEGGVETRRFVSKIYYSSPGGIESLSPAPSTNPPTSLRRRWRPALVCQAALFPRKSSLTPNSDRGEGWMVEGTGTARAAAESDVLQL